MLNKTEIKFGVVADSFGKSGTAVELISCKTAGYKTTGNQTSIK
jgi:hypothetical protein